jgi:hypothetical protein
MRKAAYLILVDRNTEPAEPLGDIHTFSVLRLGVQVVFSLRRCEQREAPAPSRPPVDFTTSYLTVSS